MLDRICELLGKLEGGEAAFPATVLYNEGWMLRLVLDAFDRLRPDSHPLSPRESATWFSEGLLPSAFLPRSRRDPLGESWTHADGVVGHVKIGMGGRTDVRLADGATQFVVLEAKMFSKLSSGVTHARYYDQAARSVGCIAEMLARAKRTPADLARLAFHVVAPRSQIDDGTFERLMTKASLRRKVARRVGEYEGTKDEWFAQWFAPTLEMLDLRCLAWEQLIDELALDDPDVAAGLRTFYDRCIRFNSRDPAHLKGAVI